MSWTLSVGNAFRPAPPDQVRGIRRTIRGTNVIERSFRELRRRLKVMGYFQNSASCNRLVFAVFSMCNARWAQPRTQIKTIKAHNHQAA